MKRFEKEFRTAHPQTIGETDKEFDNYNYTEFIENTLEGKINTSGKRSLRLIFTPKCNRSCEGCCNKDFDLPNLSRPTHFDYDEIFLTGGEPLLFFDELIGFIKALRLVSKAKIYVYTAHLSGNGAMNFFRLLEYVDGVTLTLHEKRDWQLFQQLEYVSKDRPELFEGKSLRLNIFREVEADATQISSHWKVKNNIEWIVNCPLPTNEVLMKAY